MPGTPRLAKSESYAASHLCKTDYAEGICEYLAGRVAEWADGAERSDDTTILALSIDALL